MVVRLIVSYRGTAYAGWQRQDNAVTVQQVVEEALARIVAPGVDPAERPVILHAASRTDAGVHARGQVVHFELGESRPERALVHGTNTFLPDDVRVLAAAVAPAGFHARKSALGKHYRYRLSRAAVISPLDALFVAKAPLRLELAALAAATALLPGRHDFTAFALSGGSPGQPLRTLTTAAWEAQGDELALTIAGEGFLRGMVRGLVGTLLEVGQGKRSVENFAQLLTGRPRGEAGPTAPARGLTLERVVYDEGR